MCVVLLFTRVLSDREYWLGWVPRSIDPSIKAFVLSDVKKKVRCICAFRAVIQSLGCERRWRQKNSRKHVLCVFSSAVRMVFVFNRDFIRAHLQSCTIKANEVEKVENKELLV